MQLGPVWREGIRVCLQRELGGEEALMPAEGREEDSAGSLSNDGQKRHVFFVPISWDSQSDAEESLFTMPGSCSVPWSA